VGVSDILEESNRRLYTLSRSDVTEESTRRLYAFSESVNLSVSICVAMVLRTSLLAVSGSYLEM
jgi:hypothetical protein